MFLCSHETSSDLQKHMFVLTPHLMKKYHKLTIKQLNKVSKIC